MCACGSETELTDHFLLRYLFFFCFFFTENRQKLLNDLFKTDVSFKNLNVEMLFDILLFGSKKYEDTVNNDILVHTINLLKTTKRFE